MAEHFYLARLMQGDAQIAVQSIHYEEGTAPENEEEVAEAALGYIDALDCEDFSPGRRLLIDGPFYLDKSRTYHPTVE